MMSNALRELIDLLALERRTDTAFRARSQDLGWGMIFGGQVLGQALSAATQTVPGDRLVHSLHGYFLRRGDLNVPIEYEVDRIRDGGSFTTRRVVAAQPGGAIFTMAASFQIDEPGFQHQDDIPDAPPPESLPTERERMAKFVALLPDYVRTLFEAERPFEVRSADPVEDLLHPAPRAPRRLMWIRAADPLPDDPALHRCLLAYISDYSFMTTALAPHGLTWLMPSLQLASLDHAMWFHRPLRVDEWLLHVIDSPSASGARGFARGRVFTRDGRLVASTAQEGLMRRRD
jgi:acyl-CoA thioesterase II